MLLLLLFKNRRHHSSSPIRVSMAFAFKHIGGRGDLVGTWAALTHRNPPTLYYCTTSIHLRIWSSHKSKPKVKSVVFDPLSPPFYKKKTLETFEIPLSFSEFENMTHIPLSRARFRHPKQIHAPPQPPRSNINNRLIKLFTHPHRSPSPRHPQPQVYFSFHKFSMA